MTDYTIQYLLASQKQGSYEPGQHGIIQIATVPLDADFKALEGVRSSYSHVKPDQPECQLEAARQDHTVPVEELMLNAQTQAKAKDWLVDWFKNLRLGHSASSLSLAARREASNSSITPAFDDRRWTM